MVQAVIFATVIERGTLIDFLREPPCSSVSSLVTP